MPRTRLLPAALLLALVLLAPAAAAHAAPVRATPAGGSVVPAPPREAVIVFSERVEAGFTSLEVRDANGTVVSEPWRLDGDGLTLRAALPSDLPYGVYTVVWRALSAVDGHSTRGVLSFLFPDPSQPLDIGDLPPAGSGGPAYVLDPLDPLLRALGLLGLFAALGTAVLVLGVLGPEAPLLHDAMERRLGHFAAGASAVGALATLALAVVAASAAAGRVDLASLTAGAFGAMAALRTGVLLLGAALAWAASHRRGAPARPLWLGVAACGVVAAVSISVSSHSAALGNPVLPVANDALHLLAAAAWMGGLAGLAYVLQSGDTGAAVSGIALRYSSLATVAVAVVVVSGTASSVLHLRALDALFTSPYGQVLLGKVVLVLGVLALGGRNKLVLVPAVARAAPSEAAAAGARLGRAVRLEAGLGVAVLLAAALLTALSPPAPLAAAGAPSVVELQAESEGVNVTLLLTPNPLTVGPNTFDLFLYVDGVSDANATNATLTLRPPDRALGESLVFLAKAHVGHFAGEGTYLTMPGAWTLRAQVQRTNAFDVVVDFQVEVAGGAS